MLEKLHVKSGEKKVVTPESAEQEKKQRGWNCVDSETAKIEGRERMSAEEKGAGSKR